MTWSAQFGYDWKKMGDAQLQDKIETVTNALDIAEVTGNKYLEGIYDNLLFDGEQEWAARRSA